MIVLYCTGDFKGGPQLVPHDAERDANLGQQVEGSPDAHGFPGEFDDLRVLDFTHELLGVVRDGPGVVGEAHGHRGYDVLETKKNIFDQK